MSDASTMDTTIMYKSMAVGGEERTDYWEGGVSLKIWKGRAGCCVDKAEGKSEEGGGEAVRRSMARVVVASTRSSF